MSAGYFSDHGALSDDKCIDHLDFTGLKNVFEKSIMAVELANPQW